MAAVPRWGRPPMQHGGPSRASSARVITRGGAPLVLVHGHPPFVYHLLRRQERSGIGTRSTASINAPRISSGSSPD
ncbi:MAG: hypothetical protein UV76_C0011G0031 [Candidatus Nomurabacteria bacterium GW2011_GWA2_43_15]|uniref:Uncharacterized protein n=2 Tax=Candidatus Nomuraibacteriota TaxID=1752729 RepID=A0A0G1GNQ3_9BACT|nr:MAG: hypothetical protein UV76_C0011G0031 [Candidatus Nomurabacteria bacterium GW2011_GWA2_43_15]KKT19071.1 MAG: hypothetical protein UW02_C0016G0045 [Candidatus Nomurabacteria bacterium GW2011_GWB1_43_7]